MKPPLPKHFRRRTPSTTFAYTRRMDDEEEDLIEFLLAQPNETAPFWKCVRAAMQPRTYNTKAERQHYIGTILHLIARLQYENKIVRRQEPQNVLFIPDLPLA